MPAIYRKEVEYMPIYTIVAGVNGVGKSSLSGVLKTERTDLGHIIDVDRIAVEGRLNAIDAGKIAITRIDTFLEKNISFAQETTLSGVRTEKTVKTAKEKGYTVRLFYIGLNTYDESVKRIKNRVEKGGHNISEDDIGRRFKNRFGSLAKILPYCDEAYLFDNENGFVEVGEYKNGELIHKGDYRPTWINELSKFLKTQ
jgi:predicted ABC-type ATPase